MEGRLTIGKVARQSGVTAKAIRFYERAGVLQPAARGANGYRLYTTEAVDLLRFIKQAAGLGLTLAEIRDILVIHRGGRPPCVHIQRLLKDKARELEAKLHGLLELRRRVRQSLRAWGRRPAGRGNVCPHLERQAPGAGDRRVVGFRGHAVHGRLGIARG